MKQMTMTVLLLVVYYLKLQVKNRSQHPEVGKVTLYLRTDSTESAHLSVLTDIFVADLVSLSKYKVNA